MGTLVEISGQNPSTNLLRLDKAQSFSSGRDSFSMASRPPAELTKVAIAALKGNDCRSPRQESNWVQSIWVCQTEIRNPKQREQNNRDRMKEKSSSSRVRSLLGFFFFYLPEFLFIKNNSSILTQQVKKKNTNFNQRKNKIFKKKCKIYN